MCEEATSHTAGCVGDIVSGLREPPHFCVGGVPVQLASLPVPWLISGVPGGPELANGASERGDMKTTAQCEFDIGELTSVLT